MRFCSISCIKVSGSVIIVLVSTLVLCIKSLGAAPDSSHTTFQKVPVSFKSGDNLLKGILISPRGAKTKVPAIVFCVGSSRSSTVANYASLLDSLFEQHLPLDSIALLYFDKRGVGESEGKWYNTDFEGRAADAKAAADYLASLPMIDKSRIAVAGHSQGGWITQVCLAKYPDTFVGGISLAGPTFDVKEQVRNDYASVLMCQEQMEEQAAREKALRMVKRDFFLASLLPVQENWKQLKVIRKFDPGQYLPFINKPILLMFGENDALVSPKYAIETLNKYFPQGTPSNFKVLTVAGANHSFKVADFCHKGPTKHLPYSKESKKQIAAWVRTVLLQS
ncbi:alpha/beta fold hydrolase [uncultured Pontibacter sp.]|uniref:alpha/beta hydrolase family protein n=1 Tax=uncultured Pontibacter sp. TaxID=453356 RepID=UPI002628F1D1|nr:alpha/beta fold hydrolase [uncultured Pontibacter sp.]